MKQCNVSSAILLAAFLAAAFVISSSLAQAQDPNQDQAPPPSDQAPYAKLSPDQLGRLVAPIALYPDSLVAQILSASSFPSEIVDADNWLKEHPGLSPSDLGAQADQQPWDPSVKALVQFPSVLHNLSSNLGWTSELGDAYYNQQADVMQAVQEMRQKAQQAGHLQSTPQENVQDQDGQIDIDPTDPDEVYVPAYDPWAVYGYPIAPWPYWVDVPGVWWNGPGMYFGIGFPIAPFFGFGWGWHAWGVDWYHRQFFYNHQAYFPRGPAFFNRGAYYGGQRGFGRPGGFHGWMGNHNSYRGFQAPRGGSGVRSGMFSGYNHGGMSRGFSARGQSSFGGGFHGGGFHGGGFHGGGGGFHGGGGGRR
jgi:hypothetical protein